MFVKEKFKYHPDTKSACVQRHRQQEEKNIKFQIVINNNFVIQNETVVST